MRCGGGMIFRIPTLRGTMGCFYSEGCKTGLCIPSHGFKHSVIGEPCGGLRRAHCTLSNVLQLCVSKYVSYMILGITLLPSSLRYKDLGSITSKKLEKYWFIEKFELFRVQDAFTLTQIIHTLFNRGMHIRS